MAELQTQLSNINFMSKERFDSLEAIDDGQLYAVEFPFTDGDLVHTTGNETINGVKTFNDNITAPNQVDYTRITNCITEIPQDIKLELKDGVLTLKAGSKVYVPMGTEPTDEVMSTDPLVYKTRNIFEEIVASSDVTIETTGGSGICLVCVNGNVERGNCSSTSNCVSGDNITPKNFGICYDTLTNSIQRWGDGVIVFENASLPIAVVTQTDGVVTSIDQVFNGLGYVGSTSFILPGVKGLIPNGFNADGTYKSIEKTTNKVLLKTINDNNHISILTNLSDVNEHTKWLADSDQDYTSPSQFSRYYNTSKNIVRFYNGTAWVDQTGYMKVADIVCTDGKITSLTPRQIFKIAELSGNNVFTGTVTFTEPIQGTAYRALWGDLAEYYESDKEYPRGTLVKFGGEKEITIAESGVNAVITSEPGFILNTQQHFNAQSSQAIALVGKVPVRVIGKVNKFDYLTLSDIPGVATALTEAKVLSHNIIARALESKNSEGEGLVLCVVKLAL